MAEINEASNWVMKLAKKLTNNPSNINPYVKKFLQDKDKLKAAGRSMMRSAGTGSVPTNQPTKNPWDNNTSKHDPNTIHVPPTGPSQMHKGKMPTATENSPKKQFRPEGVVNETSPQGWHFIARKILKHRKLLPKIESVETDLQEKSPPGWEGTVKAMKKHPKITNPWALAWSMKNKGYKSHKTNESLQEAKDTHYHSVFTQGNDGKWGHHFDADNKEDAGHETYSLKNQGIKTAVLRVPKTEAQWHKTDVHQYVSSRLKK